MKIKEPVGILRTKCIACGSKNLYKALDMGSMPNANGLVYKKNLNRVKSWPMKYYWCESCSMFQQLNLYNDRELFKNNYTYQTSASQPQVEYFDGFAQLVASRSNKNFAIVLASNDGTELRSLKKAGFRRVLGVDPAKNIAKIANDAGLETVNDFFSLKLSKEIVKKYGKADVVIANNVFAHIPDPRDFLLGAKNLIKPDGQIIIQVQWFRDVYQKLMIDTLYAEHYYEWTVKAMKRLARICKVKLVNVEYVPDQTSGSIRATLKLSGAETTKLEKEERNAGIYSKARVMQFQKRADMRKDKLVKLLHKLKKDGNSVVMWSVPAKVPTILNFCKINSSYIKCAYDSTPTKIGKYIPQANIMIKDEKLLNENMQDMPDYIIIGAWNYLDFAKKKLSWFTKRNGKLINMLTGTVIHN